MKYIARTRDEVTQIIDCVNKWMRICEEKNNYKPPTACDADHSSLLRYLLMGNKPFLKPPPKCYSYPAYSLMNGEEEVVELWETRWPDEPQPHVVIDQCGEWKWEDKEKGLVKHLPTQDIYCFREITAEEAVSHYNLPEERKAKAIRDEQRRMDNNKDNYQLVKGALKRRDGAAPRMEEKDD